MNVAITRTTPTGADTLTEPEAIADQRDAKLRRVRFRIRPPPRAPGAPADFLTAALRREFAIPEVPPVSANEYGGPFVAEMIRRTDWLCLDVGAGFRARCFPHVVNLDIWPSASTDVVAVGEDLPFADDQFDAVTCLAVLEHARRPWDVAREICRVLKPGGAVLVDYPFLQGVHGYPHHYFNATPGGARSLFEAECDIVSNRIGRNNHPMHALRWILDEWTRDLPDDVANAFRALTVSELLDRDTEFWLDHPVAARLGERARFAVAAGSTTVARKRCASPQPSAWAGADLFRRWLPRRRTA